MEEVRLVEDTALKAAGCKNFAGSIPVSSVNMVGIDYCSYHTYNVVHEEKGNGM